MQSLLGRLANHWMFYSWRQWWVAMVMSWNGALRRHLLSDTPTPFPTYTHTHTHTHTHEHTHTHMHTHTLERKMLSLKCIFCVLGVGWGRVGWGCKSYQDGRTLSKMPEAPSPLFG